MNERIKLLAKQCWDERPEGQLHFDNEKFAELIVRECAEFCDSNNSKLLGTMMKEHFGVEK